MKIDAFEWDENNLWKPLKHGISIIEVEEVFMNPPSIKLKTHSGRRFILGRTTDGKFVTVVFEYNVDTKTIRPITARPMTETERKLFKRRTEK